MKVSFNHSQPLQRLNGTSNKDKALSPNDRNSSTQHIATLSCHYEYRNIVGCNMLGAFGHPVAMCCDMLKMVKFFMQHLWMLHNVVVVWTGSCNNVAPEYAR